MRLDGLQSSAQASEGPATGVWALACGIVALVLSALVAVLGVAFCVALLADRSSADKDNWARFGLIVNLVAAALPGLAAVVMGFAAQAGSAACTERERRMASIGSRCGFTALILPFAAWLLYVVRWG